MNALTINVGPLLWEWHSFDNWCDTAARSFRFYQVRGCDVVCLDTKGRVCAVGKHFMTARDDGSFPVKVYAVESTQGKEVKS